MRVGDTIKKVIKNLVYVDHDESVAVIFSEQSYHPMEKTGTHTLTTS